jgi:hypothetical protein
MRKGARRMGGGEQRLGPRAAKPARASSSTRASSPIVLSIVPGGGAVIAARRARASVKAPRWTSSRAWYGPARASQSSWWRAIPAHSHSRKRSASAWNRDRTA